MPNYAWAANGSVTSVAQVDALLTSHQGSFISTASTQFFNLRNSTYATGTTYKLVAGRRLGQTFLMNGTTVTKVRLPIFTTDNGLDVAVSLYATSSGVPTGGPLASMTIPMEHLQLTGVGGISTNPVQTASTTMMLLGSPTSSAAASAPAPLAQTFVNGGGSAFTNSIWLVGGANNSVTNATLTSCFYSLWDGENLSEWYPGPPLPTITVTDPGASTLTNPVNGPMCADPTTNTFFMVGGHIAQSSVNGQLPVSNVYSTTFTTTFSGWSDQTPLPVALDEMQVTYYNGYLYAFGGRPLSTTAAANTLYYAPFVNGQLGTWTASQHISGWTQPVGGALRAINGYLIYTCGVDTSLNNFGPQPNTYIAKINSDGSVSKLTVVSATSPATAWGAYIVMGDTLYAGGGASTGPQAALTVGPDGSIGDGWLNLQPIASSVTDTNGGVSYYAAFPQNTVTRTWKIFQGEALTYTTNGNKPISLIAEPLPQLPTPFSISGLTNSTTYALTIEPLQTPDATHNCYVQLASGGSSLAYEWNGSSWVVRSDVVPLTVSGGPAGVGGGRVGHITQDSDAGYTTLIYNTTTGQVSRVATFYGASSGVGGTRDVRSLVYDTATNLLTGVI